MSDYTISQIRYHDKRAVRQMDALLVQEGIERDKNLDYSVGLYDENYELAATGSCFQNTLRCLAVSSNHQGEGLLGQVISHLIDYQYRTGYTHLFLYTKCDTARFFGDLGFYEIARAGDKVIFMENRKHGFQSYLDQLKQETEQKDLTGTKQGAIIMNANPFTLGHQYLLETAASRVDILHIFTVSEDVSLVPLQVRQQLILEGSSHINNLVYHQTGPYMISNATFPSYFLRDSSAVIRSHASLDIEVFVRIADALSINCRFVGEEPFSQVTNIYNQIMKRELENHNINCIIIPRKEGSDGSGAISASKVRTYIRDQDWSALQNVVPESTYRYFTSAAAKPVIEKIQAAEHVVHY